MSNEAEKTPSTAVVATTTLPPPGIEEGGRWATVKYGGEKTTLLCCCLAICFGPFSLCGGCAFLCPLDEKKVYVLNGDVYNSGGDMLGKTSKFKFV